MDASGMPEKSPLLALPKEEDLGILFSNPAQQGKWRLPFSFPSCVHVHVCCPSGIIFLGFLKSLSLRTGSG